MNRSIIVINYARSIKLCRTVYSVNDNAMHKQINYFDNFTESFMFSFEENVMNPGHMTPLRKKKKTQKPRYAKSSSSLVMI